MANTKKTKSRAEYNKLVNKKYSARREYYAEKQRMEECADKIRRLKRVKAVLSEQKATFKSIKKSDEQEINSYRTWKGNTRSTYNSKADNLISENDLYYRSIDNTLDSINYEITRLQNRMLESQGALGRLVGLINSLATKIENYFN